MHDDSASAEDLAVLHAALLRSHDQFVRMEPKPRSLRLARRLKRLHLSWLALPWAVVDVARLFLPAFRGGGFPAGEEQAVRLYRRLSGKDGLGRRPTATARLGGAGLTSRQGRGRRPDRVAADARCSRGSDIREA